MKKCLRTDQVHDSSPAKLIRKLSEGDVTSLKLELQMLLSFLYVIPVTLQSQPVRMESATMTTITV